MWRALRCFRLVCQALLLRSSPVPVTTDTARIVCCRFQRDACQRPCARNYLQHSIMNSGKDGKKIKKEREKPCLVVHHRQGGNLKWGFPPFSISFFPLFIFLLWVFITAICRLVIVCRCRASRRKKEKCGPDRPGRGWFTPRPNTIYLSSTLCMAVRLCWRPIRRPPMIQPLHVDTEGLVGC